MEPILKRIKLETRNPFYIVTPPSKHDGYAELRQQQGIWERGRDKSERHLWNKIDRT